jgi:hypothetical protein
MNRHERRRLAALNRGRRTGYLHRIMSALGPDGIKPTVGVHLATIEHDDGCAIYRGQGCDCVPDISVSGPDNGLTVIDEAGQCRKVARQ